MSDPIVSQPVPHRRYHYANAGFWPYLLAPVAEGCWAIDSLQRTFVFVGDHTGELDGPFALSRRKGGQNIITGFVGRDERLCVAWSDRLTIYDPAAGVHCDVGPDRPFSGLSCDAAGVWCVACDGAVLRLELRDAKAIPIGTMPHGPGLHSAAGHGAVFALASVAVGSEMLIALDQRDGSIRFQTPLEGMGMGLAADRDAVWAYLWRSGTDGPTGHAVQLDPNSGAIILHQAELPTRGFLLPLPGGAAWVFAEDADTQQDQKPPAQLRTLDLRSGHELHTFATLPLINGPAVLGPSAIWCPLKPDTARSVRMAALPLDGGAPRIHDLSGIDIKPFLPPPPPPIEAEPTEREVLDQLSQNFLGKSLTGVAGVTFDGVELTGSFPDTQVALMFRSDERPGVRYGRRCRVWEDNGALDGDIEFALLDVHLMEDFAYGLPRKDQEPGPDGIVWI